MEIFKLIPVGKDYLWGGTRLREEYNKRIDMTPLAETWECSVHPDGPSIIANGRFKGKSLSWVLEQNPEYLGSKMSEINELPVLVKFIDAKQDLSIQVHPDDEYARIHENDNGKTEMWYVMDAQEDSYITYGFAHPVTKELLKTSIETGTLDKHLQKIKVKKGDVIFVPAGMVHGIGAGVLIAEIQESSNVTYRVYDFNRKDKDGKLRKLHFDKATEIMDMTVAKDIEPEKRTVHYYPGVSRETLSQCKYFVTERLQIKTGCSFSVMENSFQILLCLEGDGQIEMADGSGKTMRFRKGECMFLPAGLGRCFLLGDATLLKVRC